MHVGEALLLHKQAAALLLEPVRPRRPLPPPAQLPRRALGGPEQRRPQSSLVRVPLQLLKAGGEGWELHIAKGVIWRGVLLLQAPPCCCRRSQQQPGVQEEHSRRHLQPGVGRRRGLQAGPTARGPCARDCRARPVL